MIIVSYGGGTNSTALLVGIQERGIVPNLITFADTGAEKPHTYEHIKTVSAWCRSIGFPEITVVFQVKVDGTRNYLEQSCLEGKMLPSIAYGFKSCSQKFKIYPQDKFMNNWPEAKLVWDSGERIIKFLGYDAGESRRAKLTESEDGKYAFQYPLIEWGWRRDDCIAAIERAGLPQPGKSACFFCPSSKKAEVMQLRMDYPELAARAVAMEKNAVLTDIAGLGRNFAWADLYTAEDNQAKLFEETDLPIICECFDGDNT